MLGSGEENVEAARRAVRAWPGGLQVGGGIGEGDVRGWVGEGAGKVCMGGAERSSFLGYGYRGG